MVRTTVQSTHFAPPPAPTLYDLYAPAKSSLNVLLRGLIVKDNIGKFVLQRNVRADQQKILGWSTNT